MEAEVEEDKEEEEEDERESPSQSTLTVSADIFELIYVFCLINERNLLPFGWNAFVISSQR